jgi:TfoX/Sxy family transcriptional regulator of competence genes
MASNPGTVEFIVEQMGAAGAVTARKMFGEYAIYCDERVVALVCDDKLFIKPTPPGKAFIGEVTEAPPYKGSKPFFLVSGELWDDREWLGQLVRLTAAALPIPIKRAPSKGPPRRAGGSRGK